MLSKIKQNNMINGLLFGTILSSSFIATNPEMLSNSLLIAGLIAGVGTAGFFGLKKLKDLGQNFLNAHQNNTEISAMKEKARLMEAAISGANDVVVITKARENGARSKIVYVNDAFCDITGYSKEEALGKNSRELKGRDCDVQALKTMANTLKEGKNFKGEIKNFNKNGAAYWMDVSVIPIHDDDGKITHYAAIERDITQRKAFEKEMQINREAAEVANRAKSDFLANMSHELRTPMNGIIGLSDLLCCLELNSDQKELADAINSSGRNLLILLNDILDLSKIEAKELTLEDIPFDLSKTVIQTIDLLKPIASRKSIALDYRISPALPSHVMGDPARVQQILNNLISNALKFTEKGEVHVNVSAAYDSAGDLELAISVEDTGIGIPKEKQEMIFTKFTQADVSTGRKYGGTGLGLAITRELIEMMGGTIDLESEEERGTIFYVNLPTEKAQISETEEQQMTGDSNHNDQQDIIDLSKKVLAVDDHPVNLLYMRKVLKKIGFTHVDEARCGQEAIILAQNAFNEGQPYDLIFMDCQMPEVDGFQASSAIREIEEFSNQVKIVAVTADAMKGARERCIDSGMNDYISKPIDVEKLSSVLRLWATKDGVDIKATEHTEDIDLANEISSIILDTDRLELFTDGDYSEEMELIDMFEKYAQETLQVLEHTLKSQDGDEWKKAAHKLKGSAANLGAEKLSSICLIAEQSANDNMDEKEQLYSDIIRAYEEVGKALESRIVKKLQDRA